MYRKFLITIGLGILVLLVSSYFFLKKDQNSPDKNPITGQTITINGVKLAVDIADEPQEQAQGLSGKKFMAEDRGMLFIFPQSLMPSFWMKDMNFSLDLIWIDASGIIIGIEKNVRPDTYPRTLSPPSPIKYVLEVNAGWSDRNNIQSGDVVLF